MPRDPTDRPFSRPSSHDDDDDSNNKLNASLNIENMLLEEFKHASALGSQANEARTQYTGFFFLLIGILASGVAAIFQFGGGMHSVSLIFVCALLLVGAAGNISFFFSYIRTRETFRESQICMYVIKEFYIKKFEKQMPEITYAFRWRLSTMPRGERIGSMTFIFSSVSAVFGSFCLAGAIFIASEQVFPGTATYILTIVSFIISMLLHITSYRRALSRESDMKDISRQEKELMRALELYTK